MSRPIVVTACMAQSSESGHPLGDHGPWHLRAGEGAVHSIITGPPLTAMTVESVSPRYRVGWTARSGHQPGEPSTPAAVRCRIPPEDSAGIRPIVLQNYFGRLSGQH